MGTADGISRAHESRIPHSLSHSWQAVKRYGAGSLFFALGLAVGVGELAVGSFPTMGSIFIGFSIFLAWPELKQDVRSLFRRRA
jgi:hypothetical protein